MMKWSEKLLALAIPVLMMLVLTGCVRTQQSENGVVEAPPQATEVEVTQAEPELAEPAAAPVPEEQEEGSFLQPIAPPVADSQPSWLHNFSIGCQHCWRILLALRGKEPPPSDDPEDNIPQAPLF